MTLLLATQDSHSGRLSAAAAAASAPVSDLSPEDLRSPPYKFYVVTLEDAVVGKVAEESYRGLRYVNFTHRGSETWKDPDSISETPRNGTTGETPGAQLFAKSEELQKALKLLAEIENQDPVRRRTYAVRQLDVLDLELTAWWLHEDRAEPRDLFIPLIENLPPLVYGGVYEKEPFLRIVGEKAKERTGNGSKRKRVSP